MSLKQYFIFRLNMMLLPLDLPILPVVYAVDSCVHKIVEKIISIYDHRMIFGCYLNELMMNVYAGIVDRSIKN